MKCWLLLIICFIQIGTLPAQDVSWQAYAAQLAMESPKTESQVTLKKPAATQLTQLFKADMAATGGDMVCEVLSKTEAGHPAWQVAANFVLTYGNRDQLADNHSLYEQAFGASMREKDHWLRYDSPRGWIDPYNFRRDVARRLAFIKSNGQADQISEPDLLQKAPGEWLARHGRGEVASEQTGGAQKSAGAPADVAEPNKLKPPSKDVNSHSVSTFAWAACFILAAIAGAVLFKRTARR